MPETLLHVAGLILARGGSQGIPLKNITPLANHPLLVWSLGAMKAFGRFDSIWVSTDHLLIAQCASQMGASVFHRSSKFAKCGSPSVDAVQEFLSAHPEVDIVGLVQCTSPFLQPEFLHKAYELIIELGYDSVFSVTRDKKLRWSEADFNDDEDNTATNEHSDHEFVIQSLKRLYFLYKMTLLCKLILNIRPFGTNVVGRRGVGMFWTNANTFFCR